MSITIHVGYPKAGSTTLQKALFNEHSEIVNLGVFPTGNVGQDTSPSQSARAPILNDGRISALHETMTQKDGIMFDQNDAKTTLNSLQSEYSRAGKATIFSNERFLSARFANPEIVEKARRVQAVWPTAQILIVIRSQLDLLKALYRDHPFDPRTMEYRPRPVSFSQWLDIDLRRPHLNHSNTLLYDRAVRMYEGLFGPERVMILPLELLQSSPEEFAKRLAGFMGVNGEETVALLQTKHENYGITTVGNRYRRFRTRLSSVAKMVRPAKSFLKRVDHRLLQLTKGMGKKERIEASQKDVERLRDLYAHDNAQLARRHDLSLAEFGYLLPEASP